MQKKFEDNYHQKAVTRNENTYILVFQLLSQMDLVYLTVKVPNSIHNTFYEIPSFFNQIWKLYHMHGRRKVHERILAILAAQPGPNG